MSFDIAVMQAFNGLSLFTVLALMAVLRQNVVRLSDSLGSIRDPQPRR